MMIIKPEAPGHRCEVPWDSSDYGSTGHEDGTLFICPDCQRAYVARPSYASLGPTQQWYRVYWWNWRLRKRIAAATDGRRSFRSYT